MKRTASGFELSATDLVGYLNCKHLSRLDRAVAEGTLAQPKAWDPLLEILWERGSAHEKKYVEHLSKSKLEVVRIDGVDVTVQAVAETVSAMKAGVPIIVQGALSHGGWSGRTDVLRRIDVPSALGEWSYEVIDTKLARETKAGTVLQLCLYSDLLRETQGMAPEFMFVVPPWTAFEPEQYRFADYAAYFRKVQRSLRKALEAGDAEQTYPEPRPHCDVCRWRVACDGRRRADDHLSLVAGISKLQMDELKRHGVATLAALSDLPLPLPWKPERGSVLSYQRIREQARLQHDARKSGEGKFELLDVVIGFGLTCLPTPSKGDVFLDLEGDPFVGEHGLEYLFGYHVLDAYSGLNYVGDWAFSRNDEKRAFETFVDFVIGRWKAFPDLHIYHYAPYEPSALKRLMGRYATREEEIDQMLRAKLFVDLYSVVRHGVRASVESYSIKKLEPFYGFNRETALPDVNAALAILQTGLELDDGPSISEEIKTIVLSYNRDDCQSTAALQDWLERLRDELVSAGTEIPRPGPGDGAPTEKITDWLVRVNSLVERLTVDVPVDRHERDGEQQARWILANILDWHRRENKSAWWEHFRLADLSAEDLLDERSGLSGLTYIGPAGGTARTPVHRYSFPPQETELRGGENLRNRGGERIGSVQSISFDDFTVEIKKRQDSVDIHPEAVYAHKVVDANELAESLVRLGEHVANHGLQGGGPYQAARDLLLRKAPQLGGEAIRADGETTLAAAVRLCAHLGSGVLPIQGPPGAGKTFTGAQMICELVSQGKTVGITANSHKVIRNLIDGVIKAADERGIDLHCCQKAAEMEDLRHRLSFAKKSEDLIQSLASGIAVGGGTAWLWSRPDAFEALDVLFVDEAAQMSLANVLAVSQSAKTVVLIGDPQQLDQPTQGSHPDDTAVSALDHILGEEQTIPPDKGLFLEETWRLHPNICAYTSELFYAGRLRSKAGLERQIVKSSAGAHGSGLRYLPIEHAGNQNYSPEEAEAVVDLVKATLEANATWVDAQGTERPLTLEDILVITPYNAQAFEIQRRLPGARVGTVDKFQGQEAPIAIYSTATSSHADAPRGMEFLYSLNRLNVATSRAKCLSILVCAPEIFEAECRTPRQAQLANAFCRYLEISERVLPNAAPGVATG
jgi:predicted RecB family nuclease